MLQGKGYVEVRPQGVSKGATADFLFDRLDHFQGLQGGRERKEEEEEEEEEQEVKDDDGRRRRRRRGSSGEDGEEEKNVLCPVDFVLCLGDDAADETTFAAVRAREVRLRNQAHSLSVQSSPVSSSCADKIKRQNQEEEEEEEERERMMMMMAYRDRLLRCAEASYAVRVGQNDGTGAEFFLPSVRYDNPC